MAAAEDPVGPVRITDGPDIHRETCGNFAYLRTREVGTMWKITGRRKAVGRRRIIATLAAVAGGAALMFGALPVASASAGVNGQMVDYCPPDDAISVMVEGINQHGQHSRWISPVGAHGRPCAEYEDVNVTHRWYWVGTVVISYTYPDSNGQFRPDITCDVPKMSVWQDAQCFGR
jgi:hypothetical protein